MFNKFNKLKQLNLLDEEEKDLLLNFFLTYSCLEYALKTGGYARKEKKYEKKEAAADWVTYVNIIKDKFDKNVNEKLLEAYNYLVENPPKKLFLVKLPNDIDWLPFSPRYTTEIGQLSEYVRCVRNNLFHGSKSHRPGKVPDRNKRLLQSCITILEEFIRISPWEVREAFDYARLEF